MTIESENEHDDLNKKITKWACNYLVSQGYTLQNKLPEIIEHNAARAFCTPKQIGSLQSAIQLGKVLKNNL